MKTIGPVHVYGAVHKRNELSRGKNNSTVRLLPRPPRQNDVHIAKTKKATKLLSLVAFYGSDGRDRTYDQLINSQLLYR